MLLRCYHDRVNTQNMPQHLGCSADSQAAIHSDSPATSSSHLTLIFGFKGQNYRASESRCTAAKRSILATWSRIVYDDVESALASVSPSVVADVYGVCTLYFNRWMLGYGFPGMHLNKYLEPIRYSTQWKRKETLRFLWSLQVLRC